jgi:hypothetical protein
MMDGVRKKIKGLEGKSRKLRGLEENYGGV